MPPASGHTSAARTARTTAGSHRAAARTARTTAGSHRVHARPRQVTHRMPISKIGWDRKFRMVMLVVFGMVGWIGLKAGLALYEARGQEAQETSLISSLQAQHRRLVAQEKALHQPATIMRDARQLGMVRAGERSYAVVSSNR